MKILCLCSTLDLREPPGITPAWWQIFKGLYEIGVEVIVVPYLGRSFDSLWWKSYNNPLYHLGKFTYNSIKFSNTLFKKNTNSKVKNLFIKNVSNFAINRIWRKHLDKILEKESNVDAALFIQVPLNQLSGIPSHIRKLFGISVNYYDGDMPQTLPKFGGFAMNYYLDADLSEYDKFIINSIGAMKELKELGANAVECLFWGVDPNIFDGLKTTRDIDVSFFGTNNKGREEWIKKMISIPSQKLLKSKFVNGTHLGYFTDAEILKSKIGHASNAKLNSFLDYRKFCSRSKINLNITRYPHSTYYASSTSRIFELASMGCCIVSNPCNGLKKWFNVGKEVLITNNSKESIDLYKWLIDDKETRLKMGKRARKRVLKEHTHIHRAKHLLKYLRS